LYAFDGTIVAPNASLRLAPVGSVGHRGSFFAQSILAEAGTPINHDPFDHWYAVFDLEPTFQCVQRYKTPNAVAVFGYVNRSGGVVEVPLGPSNRIDPANQATPPTVFEAGNHPGVLRVPFDITASATWSLAGKQVVANASKRLCQVGEYPLQGESAPPLVAVADGPSKVGPEAARLLKPDVFGPGLGVGAPAWPAGGFLRQSTASPASQTSSGDLGTVRLATQTGSTTGPFAFFITNVVRADNDACGKNDPEVRVTINGVYVGHADLEDCANNENCNQPFSVEVPRAQKTVVVYVELWDRDDAACGGDDDKEGDYSLTFDNVTGQMLSGSHYCTNEDRCEPVFNVILPRGATSAYSPDGDGFAWHTQVTGSLPVCCEWNAQFLDSGPWTDFGGVEDFGLSKEMIGHPASYSRASLQLRRGDAVTHDWMGVLDKRRVRRNRGNQPGLRLPRPPTRPAGAVHLRRGGAE
jgi:hypothetical protein